MSDPQHPTRILALDVGKVRIGIAITGPLGQTGLSGNTAQPLLTLWRKSPREDMRNLLRLLRRHGITDIVVGNPLLMSGDPGPWTLKVQAFAADLATRSGLPVHLFDERLTSVQAHALLDETRPPRHDSAERRDRKPIIDQVAAVLLLEDWLQHRQHLEARRALTANDER